jgi:hypothetical protein
MFSGLPLKAGIDDWHLRDCGKVRGRLVGVVPTRAVRQQGAKVQRPPRAKGALPLLYLSRASCGTLEMIWSIPWEREDFSLFWNNRDDPSRANFLFHGLNQANELRPAQGYCGWEADILGTTAPLGLDGVIRLEHLHDARSPCEQTTRATEC